MKKVLSSERSKSSNSSADELNRLLSSPRDSISGHSENPSTSAQSNTDAHEMNRSSEDSFAREEITGNEGLPAYNSIFPEITTPSSSSKRTAEKTPSPKQPLSWSEPGPSRLSQQAPNLNKARESMPSRPLWSLFGTSNKTDTQQQLMLAVSQAEDAVKKGHTDFAKSLYMSIEKACTSTQTDVQSVLFGKYNALKSAFEAGNDELIVYLADIASRTFNSQTNSFLDRSSYALGLRETTDEIALLDKKNMWMKSKGTELRQALVNADDLQLSSILKQMQSVLMSRICFTDLEKKNIFSYFEQDVAAVWKIARVNKCTDSLKILADMLPDDYQKFFLEPLRAELIQKMKEVVANIDLLSIDEIIQDMNEMIANAKLLSKNKNELIRKAKEVRGKMELVPTLYPLKQFREKHNCLSLLDILNKEIESLSTDEIIQKMNEVIASLLEKFPKMNETVENVKSLSTINIPSRPLDACLGLVEEILAVDLDRIKQGKLSELNLSCNSANSAIVSDYTFSTLDSKYDNVRHTNLFLVMTALGVRTTDIFFENLLRWRYNSSHRNLMILTCSTKELQSLYGTRLPVSLIGLAINDNNFDRLSDILPGWDGRSAPSSSDVAFLVDLFRNYQDKHITSVLVGFLQRYKEKSICGSEGLFELLTIKDIKERLGDSLYDWIVNGNAQ